MSTNKNNPPRKTVQEKSLTVLIAHALSTRHAGTTACTIEGIVHLHGISALAYGLASALPTYTSKNPAPLFQRLAEVEKAAAEFATTRTTKEVVSDRTKGGES